jgi:hypothetical protein
VQRSQKGGHATFADFLRKHPPSGYRMRWRDHTGSQRSTAPSQHFMNALRTKLGGIELMDAQCDNYLNPVAEGEGGKTTKKGERGGQTRKNEAASMLYNHDDVERQRARLLQQMKGASSSNNADHDHDNDDAPKHHPHNREAVEAYRKRYPVYFLTPSWDVDAEKAQRKKGNALLNPTYEEAHDAERWDTVVTKYANGSKIGRKRAYDPDVHPSALVAGGRLAVRLRQYKGSHAEKGIIRVVADELLGFNPRDAYVEDRMREWRRAVHKRKREGQAGDLGVVDARRDETYLPPNMDAARNNYHDQYTRARARGAEARGGESEGHRRLLFFASLKKSGAPLASCTYS